MRPEYRTWSDKAKADAERIRLDDPESIWESPSPYWKGGGKPATAQFDFETYSEIDIGNCGSYRYIDDDSFEVLLLAIAFDDEPVFIVDAANGEKIPEIVWAAIFDEGIIKSAWNAQFERCIFSKLVGQTLSPDSWRCSMVWAASLSLPLKLKTAAEVLKTGEQKDDAGERLIKFFSVPCRPTKTNGGRTRNLPEHAPEDWELFKSYCLQDVRTERDIRRKLESFPMLPQEWGYYHMDQRINDRGVLIDKTLVEQAITCDLLMTEEMTNRAYELTGLENPNSVSQLKGWLEERGIEVSSLGKKDVAAMIKEIDKGGLDQEALDMLKLRLQMAKSSVKKYQAADRYICSDRRAHGLFQFSGANRTQRWAGRGIQLQNLPQNHISTLDEARDLVKMGCFDMVESIYGNTPDILSQLIRTMLIPKPGCEFIVADFSAIEARVLAWLAGEQWRLDAFKRGEDIYCASASQMFGVPVEKHGINGELRAKGKVAELACIAEGQMVLTDCGEVPIEKVTTDMKVWDGEEWVEHEGVVYKGEREVITYEGLTATPDHLVWIEGKSSPVCFGEAARSGAHLVQTGDGGRAVRLGEDNQPGFQMGGRLSLLCGSCLLGLRENTLDILLCVEKRKTKVLSQLHQSSPMAEISAESSKAQMRKCKRPIIRELWWKGDKIRISKCEGSGYLDSKESRNPGERNGIGQNRLQWELCTWEYKIHTETRECEKQEEYSTDEIRTTVLAFREACCNQETEKWDDQGRDYSRCRESRGEAQSRMAIDKRTARLYDIRNAGRHHRFTVSGRLVHNCGYGGAAGALISMGALDMGLSEAELPDLIDDWRNSNPHIVQFWWDVEKAATETVKDHKERTVGRIGFQFSANTLWLVLPSGRKLAYIKPKMQPNRFGRMAITFESLNAANKWARGETYSGKLVENITQATARDLLAEAMWRMEQNGLDIVGHIHDEVILEVTKGSISVDEVCAIMGQNPVWADGICLSAAGYCGDYYFKD